MEPGQRRRAGRPAREIRPGERVPLSFRVRPELKARIDEEAAAKGRSIAQEVEMRMELLFTIEELLGGLKGIKLASMLFSNFRRGAEQHSLALGETELGPREWLKDAGCLEAGLSSLVSGLWLQHPN